MMTKQTKVTNKPKTIVGIDYSLTSPAVCVNEGGTLNFYYLTNKKKWIGKQSDNIIGYEHKEWKDPIERFGYISDFVFNILAPLGTPKIFIEGYSYGSKGQGLFQIAENCGILKYRILEKGLTYEAVVPSVVKKGATGKGNADKDMMLNEFIKQTKIDLKKIFDTDKATNPLSDIADSYFIQKIGSEK